MNENVIRRRNPRTDDGSLFRLADMLLMPSARSVFPSFTLHASDMGRRLNQGETFVAAKDRQPPFGFILCRVKDQNLWIELLAVHAKRQGKGYGSALMSEAERHGRRNGCTRALLYVYKDSEGAQRFYAKNGYVPVLFDSGMQCYLYCKSL